MPQIQTFMETIPQPVLSPDDIYQETTGRKVYDELSITGLNRAPIEILTAFITAASTLEGSGLGIWPEIKLATMCEYVLVDGSFVVRYVGEEQATKDHLDEPYVFLEDCLEIHRNLIVQQLRNERDIITDITRVYERGETSWTVRDIKGYGNKNQVVESTETYPLDYILSYPYGKGLLWPNQKTYRRLEEIQESIRAQTGPAALALIVTGYAGDWKRATDTFAKGAKIIGIPGTATVTRVASNNTADQLMANSEKLEDRYIENMHLIKVSETATISGKSRIIAMRPMLSYVDTIRLVLDEIYEQLGYKITWGGIDIVDTSEKDTELNLLERGKKALVLSVQEFMRLARALFGLTGKPVGDLEEKPEEPEVIEEEIDTEEDLTK